MDIRPVQPEALAAAQLVQPKATTRPQQQPIPPVEAVQATAPASSDLRRTARQEGQIRQRLQTLDGSDLSSEVEKKAGTYIYRLVNRTTGEVVREFPPADLVEALADLGESSSRPQLDEAA